MIGQKGIIMDIQNRLVYIPTELLEHHPKNPRTRYTGIEELAESIKAKGVMQNLTVVKADETRYFVVIGNRRLEAARMAGLEALPCAVADMNEREIVSTMLVENIQRSDLTAIEQAQGFQLMLDLGETAASIAEKTGFSETTVRRRIKWTELDKDALRKVSENRQINLGDLDKLGEIKDVKKRNKLLETLGTDSFAYEYRRASDEEKKRESEKKWRKLGAKFGITEIESSERWSGKYKSIATAHTEKEFEDIVKKKAAFFSPQGECCFMCEKADAKTPKKSKEEIEYKERVEKLGDEFTRMYEARAEFVKNVSASNVKERESVIAETLFRAVLNNYGVYHISAGLMRVMAAKNKDDAIKAAAEEPLIALFRFTYLAFADGEYMKCCGRKGEFLRSERLEKLYDFLEACGYTMSGAERAMLDGSSEMFYNGE